jgi:hypothetical protein
LWAVLGRHGISQGVDWVLILWAYDIMLIPIGFDSRTIPNLEGTAEWSATGLEIRGDT